MIYLASPYSSPDPAIVAYRVEETRKTLVKLIRQGNVVFSPIFYLHNIAMSDGFPTSAAFWYDFNRDILLQCVDLLVLRLDGWQESLGVQAEIKLAQEVGIKLSYIEA